MSRKWLPVIACPVLGFASAWQIYVLPQDGDGLALGQVLIWRFLPWQVWLLGMPLAVLLRRRFALTARGVLVSLPLHLVLFAAIAVSFEALDHTCGALAGVEPYATYGLRAMLEPLLIKGVVFDAFIYTGTVAVDIALDYRQRARESDERLAEARLAALKMQLHPHFLFNTLNSITVLIRKRDNDVALEMVEGLAALLRYSLQTMNVELVPLRDELAFVRRYLAIQSVRFSDRLHITVECPPELDDVSVPSLLTQPLVENAIKHGAARRTASSIDVRASAIDGQRLRIEVRDGGGEPVAGDASEPVGHGVGLSHVRERLAKLYPGRHRFTLATLVGGGTTAEIELPLERANA